MPFDRVYNELTYSDNIGVLSFSSFRGRPRTSGLNYNDTPYVAALNRALQLEHTAVAIYAVKQRSSFASDGRAGATAMDRTEFHNKALRQLVQLIFAQRGLPSSGTSGLTAVTGKVAARVSRFMPPLVQEPMLGVSAQRIEYALARRYRQILEIAPLSDREMISALLNEIVNFTAQT